MPVSASLRRRRRDALPAGRAGLDVRVVAVCGFAVIPPGWLGRRSTGALLDVGHRLDGDGHRVVVGRRTPPAPAESDADKTVVVMVTMTAMVPAAVAASAAGAGAGWQDLARERGLARNEPEHGEK